MVGIGRRLTSLVFVRIGVLVHTTVQNKDGLSWVGGTKRTLLSEK